MRNLKKTEIVVDVRDLKELGDAPISTYADRVERQRKYLYFKNKARLIEAEWCRLLGITLTADNNYVNGNQRVPDTIIERGRYVSKALMRALTRVRRKTDEQKRAELYKNSR